MLSSLGKCYRASHLLFEACFAVEAFGDVEVPVVDVARSGHDALYVRQHDRVLVFHLIKHYFTLLFLLNSNSLFSCLKISLINS
jgi:hypothetical protein